MDIMNCPSAVRLETGEKLPGWFYPVFTPLLERGGEFGPAVQQYFSAENLEVDNPLMQFSLVQIEFPPHRKDDLNHLETKNLSRQLELYTLFQQKIVSRITGQNSFRGFSYSLNGHLYFLVYYHELESLHRLFEDEIETFNLCNGYSLHGIISVGADSFLDIPSLYRDIRSKNQYRRYMKVGTVLLTSGINIPGIQSGEEKDHDSSVAALASTLDDVARKLNAHILNHNREGAMESVRQFVDFSVEESVKGQFTPQMTMMRQMFINSLMQFTLNEFTLDTAFWQEHNPEFSMERANDIDRTLLIWTNLVDEMLGYQFHQKQKKLENKLIEVRNYIKENYSNTELCIQSIADYFHIPRATLTREYQKFWDESINETIHKQRIARSKFLLQTTSLSINDISISVGYTSISTMYRAFSKYEGIPPSKFSRKH